MTSFEVAITFCWSGFWQFVYPIQKPYDLLARDAKHSSFSSTNVPWRKRVLDCLHETELNLAFGENKVLAEVAYKQMMRPVIDEKFGKTMCIGL